MAFFLIYLSPGYFCISLVLLHLLDCHQSSNIKHRGSIVNFQFLIINLILYIYFHSQVSFVFLSSFSTLLIAINHQLSNIEDQSLIFNFQSLIFSYLFPFPGYFCISLLLLHPLDCHRPISLHCSARRDTDLQQDSGEIIFVQI